jgi:hypothetical protein
MAGCRAHYNIYAWIIAVVMCVSYLGVCGLYNPNVRNYSAHSVSLLGESRGIDAGNNDVLMVDSSAGLVIQTRNIRTGNSEESIDDTWMLSAVLAALLLSLIFQEYPSAAVCHLGTSVQYLFHQRECLRWMARKHSAGT